MSYAESNMYSSVLCVSCLLCVNFDFIQALLLLWSFVFSLSLVLYLRLMFIKLLALTCKFKLVNKSICSHSLPDHVGGFI